MTSKKEKSTSAYFNTPNATNQKIMTVNQSTGEINFLDKSVQALNDDLVNDYATIKDAMKLLLGDNLQGTASGKIFEMNRDKADKSWTTTELGKKQGSGNYLVRGAAYEIQVTDNPGKDNRVLDVWNGNLSAATGGSGCVSSGGGMHRKFCLR